MEAITCAAESGAGGFDSPGTLDDIHRISAGHEEKSLLFSSYASAYGMSFRVRTVHVYSA